MIGGNGRIQRVGITRPANATAYATADAIGDVSGSAILSFNKLASSGIPFMLISAAVEYHVASVPASCELALELYRASPTAIIDNDPWSLLAADVALHIGSISFGAPVDKVGTLKVEVDNLFKMLPGGSGNGLFAILTAKAGFTPAGNSETLAVTLAGYPI